MADETVTRNLQRMDELDFAGWNEANWEGVFTRYHTDDVLVEVHGSGFDARHSCAHRGNEGLRREHRWRARPGQVPSDRVRLRRLDLRGRRARER